MSPEPTPRRRWLGGLALGAALAMLAVGQTVLAQRFDALSFLLYWTGCLGLTGVAIILAVRELRALQRRNLEEQRNLFHATLNQIAADAKSKPRRQGPARKPDSPSRGPRSDRSDR